MEIENSRIEDCLWYDSLQKPDQFHEEIEWINKNMPYNLVVFLYKKRIEEMKAQGIYEQEMEKLNNYLSAEVTKIASFFKSNERQSTEGKIINYLTYRFYQLDQKVSKVLSAINMGRVYRVAADNMKEWFDFEKSYIHKEEQFYINQLSPKALEKVYSFDFREMSCVDLDLDVLDEIFKCKMSENYQFVHDLDQQTYDAMKQFLVDTKHQKTLQRHLGDEKKVLSLDKKIEILYNQLSDKKKALTIIPLDELTKKLSGFSNGLDLNPISLFKEMSTQLISSKADLEKLDKLIMIRNFLEFCRTDLLLCKTDEVVPFEATYHTFGEQEDWKHNLFADINIKKENYARSLEQLKETYSSWNEQQFVQKQGNFIYSPKVNLLVLKTNHQAADGKQYKNVQEFAYNCNDNTLKLGIIVEALGGETMFIHIQKDMANENGKYEIQFNLMPLHRLDLRVQMLRIDNYQTQGTHKNIGGTKLQTYSHIHIYNQLDLVRGKKNGGYDIAYNLDDQYCSFDDALKLFFQVLGIDTCGGLEKEVREIIDGISINNEIEKENEQ